MNRTAKTLAATLLALGLAVSGVAVGGADSEVTAVGSTGCCKN